MVTAMFRVVFCLFLVLALVAAKPPVFRTRNDIEKFWKYLESTRHGNDDDRRQDYPDANEEEISGRFEGDIILDEDEIDKMVEEYAKGRNALITEGSKWPQNTVVVMIADGFFNDEQIAAIWVGLREIERETCIRFVNREPHHEVYVNITGFTDGCYANVGYRESRGAHTLNLTPRAIGVGCFRHGTIVHEMLHILGFYHMHSSPERDEFVEIVWENIIEGREHNFITRATDVVHNLGVEYDYVSCMHYGPNAFTNSGPTIIPLKEYEGTMGQRVYITERDWIRVRRHYNCPMNWGKN